MPVLSVFITLFACGGADVPAPPTPEPVEHPAAKAQAELASMDERTPVPLQPMMAWHQKQNMMEHLEAIQGITDALAREDWTGIVEANRAIATSPQMAQMCEHMGAGADGFTKLALEFHRRADAIGVAAEQQDGTAVLQAVGHTLAACTQCHATYRQEVVDAATFAERTGSSHEPSAHGH